MTMVHRWLRAVAAAGIAVLVAPAAPAHAAPVHAAPAPACASAPFTARSTADLLKVSLLDLAGLGADLPALLDVRLAEARSEVDSGAEPYKSTATAAYADARLLGLRLPGLPAGDVVATQRAPRAAETGAEVIGPHAVSLPSLDTGLLRVDLGDATAEATWEDAYRCGTAGALTRASTTLADVAVLGGTKREPAAVAVDRATGATRRTSLLRLGPSAAAQSATDVVGLPGGGIAVAAGAGAALTDVSLFDGTDQEISVKVVTQPKLVAVAGGTTERSAVTYEGPVFAVAVAGKPVAGLDTTDASVTLNLFGRVTPGISTGAALLSVRLSLGGLRQEITDERVTAEAASLRVEVMLGRAHLLDVALGHLSVEAAAPVMTAPAADVAAPAAVSLPVTGSRAGLLAATGGGLLVAGAAVALLTRRRRLSLRAD